MTRTEGAEQVPSQTHSPPHINFFKPHSPFAKDTVKLSIVLLVIWVLAVFGFQFLLIALQKPTPEPTHVEYKQTWGDVEAGKATAEQSKVFARSILSVLGKNIVLQDKDKKPLKEALSSAAFGLLEDADKAAFTASLAGDGKDAVRLAAGAIGLEEKGFDKIMRGLLPSSLVPVAGATLTEEVRGAIPGIMDRYLIHNRSALTDFNFLGFPFHYWFTAQFLLILFVGQCFIYAKLVTTIMIKHGRIKKVESKA